MNSLLVVKVDIVFDGLVRLVKTVVAVEPDLLFFDRSDHSFDIGIVIGGVIAGVLSLDSVLGEKGDKFLRAGLSAVIAAQRQTPTRAASMPSPGRTLLLHSP